MIFPRLAILQSFFGVFRNPQNPDQAEAARDAAAAMGHRWAKALAVHPELVIDLIKLGGLLKLPPQRMLNGMPEPGTQDLYQCGRYDGRRELATQLLALSGLSYEDFNQLMENDHDDH